MTFSFKISSRPECADFLRIKYEDDPYMKIEDFITCRPNPTEEILNKCRIKYRGHEIKFTDYDNEYNMLSYSLKFVEHIAPLMLHEENYRVALYFSEKSAECLQFSRFFIMKSALLLDTNYNINWSNGYIAQFYFRCIYFGTASTWLSNTYDHIVQSIYWALNLYTSVTDRNGNAYDKSWDKKKIAENCTYEFVVGELKKRGLTECRKHMSKCSGKIEEVRKWANYIKHKGGIDYKYLEPETPFKIYISPTSEACSPADFPKSADKMVELDEYKSPVTVDIDNDLSKLIEAYNAIFDCINQTIGDIDYQSHSIQFE